MQIDPSSHFYPQLFQHLFIETDGLDLVEVPKIQPSIESLPQDYRIETDGKKVQEKLRKAAQRAYHQQIHELQKVIQQFGSGDRKFRETFSLGEDEYDFDTVTTSKGGKVEQTYDTSESLPDVHIASSIGARKDHEDRHVAASVELLLGKTVKRIQITGLFDGYQGDWYSIDVSEKIVAILKYNLELFNQEKMTDIGIWNALKISLPQCRENRESSACAGTTANVCIQIDNALWVANLGDSRALLVDDAGHCLQLNEDQRPTDPYYQTGYKKRGGNPEENDGTMIRSIGCACKGCLTYSARPKVTKYLLDPAKTYTLGQCCDGVFDVMTTNHVGTFFFQRQKKGDSLRRVTRNLVPAAIETFGSTDNVTVLARKIKVMKDG